MKTLRVPALAFLALAALSGPGAAQQKANERSRPGPVEMEQPAAQEQRAARPMTGEVTGKVVDIDPRAMTFTLMVQGRAITFSAARLGKLPRVAENLDVTFAENPGGPPMATAMAEAGSAASMKVGGKRHCNNKDVPGGYHDPLYTLNVCK